MARGKADPSGDRDAVVLVGATVLLVVLAVGGVWLGQQGGAWLDGAQAPTRDPLRLFWETVVTRHQPWSASASGVVIAVGLLLAVAAFAGVLFWPRGHRQRPDRAARHMAQPADLAHLTAAGATRKAGELGVTASRPGLPLGRMVRGGRQLFSTWEDMLILIAGPRIGWKTSAWAVPAILAAPGACMATSNKSDLWHVTAAARALVGRVWPFDPQRIVGGVGGWWWNPLTFIMPTGPHTDPDHEPETAAVRLAAQLVSSARPPGAKVEPYWDGQAEHLISLLLLAAALDYRPITQVYVWLTESTSEEACELLRAHGYALQADSAYSLAHLPDKQRAGVFDTARSSLTWLTSRSIQRWVTPGPGEEFHPSDFARSTDTLYALSRDGDASAGPLVAALTMAVFDALEAHAAKQPRGRLAIPFVGVLDEAANIARVRHLDALYSHYGSRGIMLLTILQSWSQGVDAWGREGMAKLWSAANHRVYAGGVDDSDFLTRLSRQIGTVELVQHTHSTTRDRRTHSRQAFERVILTSAELGELPAGRAVLFSSGSPAVLVATTRWFYHRPTAELVGRSS
jgi:type IV secretory pathway TraG/TraD family ATPase VirD4